jgi:hypothetical protein
MDKPKISPEFPAGRSANPFSPFNPLTVQAASHGKYFSIPAIVLHHQAE